MVLEARGVGRNRWKGVFLPSFPPLSFVFPSFFLFLFLSLPSSTHFISFLFAPLEVGRPLNQLWSLGECCKLPQWGSGWSPGGKRIWYTLELSESRWWQSFWEFWSACFTVDRSKFCSWSKVQMRQTRLDLS